MGLVRFQRPTNRQDNRYIYLVAIRMTWRNLSFLHRPLFGELRKCSRVKLEA